MAWLFWSALALVVYTYVLYPVLIHVLARRRPAESIAPQPAAWPALTVVIAVHNERERIARKLVNLAQLDYPADCLNVLFVSDGSNDGSVELLQQQTSERVQVLAYAERRGKPYALNCAMQQVKTPLVVFTDVRQTIEPGAIKKLVSRLLQPGMGAVSGELVHVDPETQAAANIGLYWRYEKWIRKSESRYDSTAGLTGALYAIRREDFVPLAEDAILDDFELPMLILRSGRRVVLESGALLFDELQKDVEGERRRKVRTLTGNFQAVARHPWLLSPLHNRVWLQFVSHKLLRLVVPWALLAMVVASLLTPGWFYALAAVAQLSFYGVALMASASPRLRRNRLASFSAVFLELNLAAMQALFRFAKGRIDVRWEKT